MRKRITCIYLLKVNNRNSRRSCKICSKLTMKTPKRHKQRRSGVFIVNFEHIPHLVLVFLLLTLNMQLPTGKRFKYLMCFTSNWLTHESAERKPDWLRFNSLPIKRKLYNQLKIIFTAVLPNIGKREMSR